MTMPKKGRRKIVVEDQTYHYMVKHTSGDGIWSTKKAIVTIEAPDGRIFADKSTHYSIKPAYVEALVRKHLL